MARLEETRPQCNDRARGLVSSRKSGARVQARTFAPPPELALLVESFWVGRWDLPPDAPHTTRLLGDPCVHVVLADDRSGRPPERLVGVWTELWENTLAEKGVVRAAKLRAGAAGALLDDASSIRNQIVALPDRFASVPDRSGLGPDPADDHAMVERLADWLCTTLSPRFLTRAAIDACERIRSERGIRRVADLARALGRSERSVQKLFRVHVGAGPKFLIRRHRLQEAALRLERGDDLSLAELAHHLGYADQAHFARDWRAAVSMSATRFAKSVHE